MKTLLRILAVIVPFCIGAFFIWYSGADLLVRSSENATTVFITFMMSICFTVFLWTIIEVETK